MQRVERRENLSNVLDNSSLLDSTIRPIFDINGHFGGRFYVNEHGVIFTPLTSGDGDEIDYFYCGQVN